jgi:hypothetical protein
MGQGSQQLSQAIADTPTPELWNPMSLVVPQTLAREGQAAAAAGYRASTQDATRQAQADAWNRGRLQSGLIPHWQVMGGWR